MRYSTYNDVAGVPTICYGETKDIHQGDTRTKEQCAEMLMARLQADFGPAVDACIKNKEIPPHRKAAYVDFAYNLGESRFCKSPIVVYELADNIPAACDAILPYNKARVMGVLTELKGLTKRRNEERKLCLGEMP